MAFKYLLITGFFPRKVPNMGGRMGGGARGTLWDEPFRPACANQGQDPSTDQSRCKAKLGPTRTRARLPIQRHGLG